jgi:hypothetical protein
LSDSFAAIWANVLIFGRPFMPRPDLLMIAELATGGRLDGQRPRSARAQAAIEAPERADFTLEIALITVELTPSGIIGPSDITAPQRPAVSVKEARQSQSKPS